MKFDIVRAWKDETYRQTLSEELLAELPANPVGELELGDSCLEAIYGGTDGDPKSPPPPPPPKEEPDIKIISILTNARFFSVNVLSNPFNQTCFQNR